MKWCRKQIAISVIAPLLLTIGCASVPRQQSDYSKFREEDPRSILIVPVVNRSIDVDAPDYFLSTSSLPVAERGYYVFPVNMIKHVLEDDGLSDADLVHNADSKRLAELFGADSILYISIERWDAKYAVFSTTVTVQFNYIIKSGKTGEVLWQTSESLVYTPQNNNSSGNTLADLIGMAITAAITKAAPNYIPLAKQANDMAVTKPHKGLPAGPYLESYKNDMDSY